MTDSKKHRPETVATHAGLKPWDNHGIINPPVYHASTILFKTMSERRNQYGRKFEKDVFTYGLRRTPTSQALETAIADLEGGYDAIAVTSGLAAVTAPMMAFLKSGDHLLMVDSVYQPTREFCDGTLTRFGIDTTYYDPLIGASIGELIRPNTQLVFLESPGSQTFEVQDVPAIAAVGRRRGITTMIDNTWATPLYFKPFAHGVDVSIHAATKYIVGHSDALLGLIVCSDKDTFIKVRSQVDELGHGVAPDDAYLGLRGLRSMPVRLQRHQENALTVIEWLRSRPEVARILYPALEDDPGHSLWKRDFTGANGLFGVVLKPSSPVALEAMIDGMELFGLGSSWGGFESLILPANPAKLRTATEWTEPGPLIRLHVGLEDPRDLIDDLAAGFDRFNTVSKGG